MSNAELARRDFVAAPTMLRILDGLEQSGLVTRTAVSPEQRARQTVLQCVTATLKTVTASRAVSVAVSSSVQRRRWPGDEPHRADPLRRLGLVAGDEGRQVVIAREVAEERTRGQSGSFGDLRDGRLGEPPLGEQLERRALQPFAVGRDAQNRPEPRPGGIPARPAPGPVDDAE